MAAQSPTGTNSAAADEMTHNPAPAPAPATTDKKDPQNSREETATESFKRSISSGLEEPMREEQIQNAVKFLSHPKVRGSPVIYRRSFLEKKGLMREEIDEAFRRVPDPPSNAASVEAVNITQGSASRTSTSLQPQLPTQNIQTAVVPSNVSPAAPALRKSSLQRSHFFIAIGVLTCSGGVTGWLFRTVVLPRLKAWIRKVAKGEDHAEKKDKVKPSLAEEAAEAAKTAASSAAVVAKACQNLLSARNEEKKYFEAFVGLLDAQMKEMKSMGSAIRNLEATKEVTHPHEKRIADILSASENGSTNNIRMISHIDRSDPRVSSTSSPEGKMNGTVDVRSSSAPASVEPTATPYSKSFMEIMAMVQRGETPPGIKEINDMPPNPNQRPSNPRLAARAKPWEVSQQVQQNAYDQPHRRVNGSISEVQDNGEFSQMNGKPFDGSDPWWKQKTTVTDTEHEAEEHKVATYGIGSKNWPGRDWVPPQTPSVAMAEAAAAIRKPKPSVQKQQLASDLAVQPSDREDETVRTAHSAIGVESSGDGIVDVNHASEIQEEHVDEVAVH